MTSAIASRVTSSWVGPMPPQTTTASAWSSISRIARDHPAEVVADLAVLHRVDADGRELLTDPRGVRVDDLAEQQLGADRQDVSSHSWTPASRGGRCRSPEMIVNATATQRMRELQRVHVLRPAGARTPRPRASGARPSTCRAGGPAARCRAVPPRTGRSDTKISRAAISATGHPPDVAAGQQRDEPADGEELVGERVEERAGPGGAVAPRDPAVDAVGAREHEPERDREPGRALALDEDQRRDREEQPGDRDEVRRASRPRPARTASSARRASSRRLARARPPPWRGRRGPGPRPR